MFLMLTSRHVKGGYQWLLKMLPVFAENGGIHDATHFFKNSELNVHSSAAERMLSNNLFFIGFVAQSMLGVSNSN